MYVNGSLLDKINDQMQISLLLMYVEHLLEISPLSIIIIKTPNKEISSAGMVIISPVEIQM